MRLQTAACLTLACVAAGASAAEYLSPLALTASKDAKHLYVAAYTGKQLIVVDVAGGKVVSTISLPDRPSGVAISPDGSKLYVTGAEPSGRVHVVEPGAGKCTGQIAVGHTPTAPVITPDGKILFVCNRFNNNVGVVDLAAGKQVATIPVAREPFAAAMTPDGKLLFVANHLPAGPADGAYTASVVSVIDTTARKVVATVELPNGSVDLQGVCVSPDGKVAYVTHILARYQLPTTQLERGWMNTNAVTIIDVAAKKRVTTVLVDEVDRGAANPWGLACSADGKYLCLAQAGTHDVSVIDRAALHERLAKVARGEKVLNVTIPLEEVPNELSFLAGIRRRLALPGKGPRGLVVLGDKAYAAQYFSDSIGVVTIDANKRPDARSLALGKTASEPPSAVRLGEQYFNDASLCFQNWQSCASCHPDGRADGLNWDLMNDGLGNPKNTKSMLLSHQTPPVMMMGVRDRAETAVRAGIRHIQFAVRPEQDAVAIDTYLKSLTPVPSPYLAGGQMSEAARRGEQLFKQVGCAMCHAGPLYTDMKKYDVGTGKGREKDQEFDTPTLIEVWRTAPYLYDGRAAAIKDVLTKFNTKDRHGATSGLTQEQIGDLAEYVLTR
ncbi:MAG: c-type cytochrome [Phycisphaerae bacterium]|nr:c-type cytochrome [Phycisphaerae bacterium]